MELIISGRHLTVDQTLKSYIEERMDRISAEYPKLTSARVVLHTERGMCLVEIHLYGKHIDLNAKSKGRDFFVAVDTAAEKIDSQLKKHLQKMQDHRGVTKEVFESDLDDSVEDEEFFEEEFA